MSNQSFEENFTEWNDCTGALREGGSWEHEVKCIFIDADRVIESQAGKIEELEYDIALILGHANVADREYFEKENEELESQNKILRDTLELVRNALAQIEEEKALEVV